MTDIIMLETAQRFCDNADLLRLDRTVAYLLHAAGLEAPDFDEPTSTRHVFAVGDEESAAVPEGADLSGIPGVHPHAVADPAAQRRLQFVMDVRNAIPHGTWAEMCRVMDKTGPQVSRYATKLLKARFLLPRVYEKVTATGQGYDRLEYAASRGVEMDPAYWDFYDRCLADVDSRAGTASFRAAVEAAVALLKTPDHNAEKAHEERCVQVVNLGDGRSLLQMSGPTLEVQALMKRLEGFARNIRIALSGVLDEAQTQDGKTLQQAGIDPASVALADDRNMAQLMFDMLAAYAPSLGIDVAVAANRDGEPDPDNVTDTAPDTHHDSAPESGVVEGGESVESITLHMPQRSSWLQSQAQVSVLVPATTLLGMSNLPATLNGREPIPADAAMRLAGEQSTLYRILCHPATGEILDEPAHAYRVSSAMRRTLEAKYAWCTFPGCTRPAERCETEHIEPFNHADVTRGGQSSFRNCHVMCRAHHALKTAGHIRVSRSHDGALQYSWDSASALGGFFTTVTGHSHLMGRIAAREILEQLAHSDDCDDENTMSDSEGRAVSLTDNDADADDADNDHSENDATGTDSPVFPLQVNWDALDIQERRLPAIRGLREMLAADGLMAPVPPLKLGQQTELDVLYQIARAQHMAAYHQAADGTVPNPATGSTHPCAREACTEHTGSTDPEVRAACLGVSNKLPGARREPPPSGRAPISCPYASEHRSMFWKPAGWAEFSRHRFLAEILADPWRHHDPLVVTDHADAQTQSQIEWEADQPPF